MDHPKLEKGKALIITGAEGSGKTTLAIAIALAYGDFATSTLRDMKEHRFAFSESLINQPNTIIIEDDLNELFSCKSHFSFIKSLIFKEKTQLERPGQKPILFNTPNFIFCTGSMNAIKISVNNRRFTIIDLDNK